MRTLHSLLLLAGLLLPASTQASEALQQQLQEALKNTAVPALGVAVLRDGAIADSAVAGIRRNDGNEPVMLNDPWLIGSTGKVMTVAMVARLVDAKRLDWNTPLIKLLPTQAKTMHPAYRQRTLVELLSHRAGFASDLRDRKQFDSYYTDQRPLPEQRLSYITAALREKPAAKPGRFAYSNSGFLIAAVVAEQATGQSYETLMQEQVFAPLGMRNAGFGDTSPGQPRGHQAGKPMTQPRKFDDGGAPMYSPAGFLHLSLEDWARFNLDQLAGSRGEGKLLSAASYRLMQTAQAGSPAGLDWGVQPSIAGRKGPVLMHAGSDGNWLAYAILFPKQNSGVLAVANAGEDMNSNALLQGILGKLLPTLSPPAAP